LLLFNSKGDASVITSKLPPDLTATVFAEKVPLHQSSSLRGTYSECASSVGLSSVHLNQSSTIEASTLPRRSGLTNYFVSPLKCVSTPTDAGSCRGFNHSSEQSSSSSSVPLAEAARLRRHHQRRQSDPINRLSTAWSEPEADEEEASPYWLPDTSGCDVSDAYQRLPVNVDSDSVTWMSVDYNGGRLVLQQSGIIAHVSRTHGS
jgi:hypothetical protein